MAGYQISNLEALYIKLTPLMPDLPFDVLGEVFRHERSHDCGLLITVDFNPYQRVLAIILTRLRSQAGRWAELSIICLHPHDLHELLSPLPSGVSLEHLSALTGVSLNMLNFQFRDAQQSIDSFPMDILLTAPCLHTLHAEIFEPHFFNTLKSWELSDHHTLLSIQDLVVVPGKQAPEMLPGVRLLPFPNAQQVVIFPCHGDQTLIAEQRSNLISLTLCVSGYSSRNAITDAIFVLDKVPMATKDVLDLLDPLIHLRNLTIHEINPLSPVGRRHFPISQELFNRLLQDNFLPNLRGIDLDWCLSVNGSMYESLLTQVAQLQGLQEIREYRHMGHIGGSRYTFRNDLISYFEMPPMDFEDESDLEEPSTIESASVFLTEMGIALPQIDPDDSDSEKLPMIELAAVFLEAGIAFPELTN
ncbi:hypothetical protein ARMSODRAFT_982040 [Armillaria solidipes]|uniref:Uncharacterized protein n=1 Tax=Armillaria solidipes TaxID=1076256 RepID=A0A2H3APR4_9AGAR|nr:hypothetical protein ARMSODRAFT_982040 [Armillaria solidipes]